jgi:predicted ribosome quality control (RQC) complex YloA/Tae2 family protein
VLVGRSNQDNDRVTFKAAGPDDLWFHARGVPGAHVVLRTGGRDPSEDEITAAASAAAYYSAARATAHVSVDYTERKHVRKPRGSRPGFVTYERERTVQVVPRIPES